MKLRLRRVPFRSPLPTACQTGPSSRAEPMRVLGAARQARGVRGKAATAAGVSPFGSTETTMTATFRSHGRRGVRFCATRRFEAISGQTSGQCVVEET